MQEIKANHEGRYSINAYCKNCYNVFRTSFKKGQKASAKSLECPNCGVVGEVELTRLNNNKTWSLS